MPCGRQRVWHRRQQSSPPARQLHRESGAFQKASPQDADKGEPIRAGTQCREKAWGLSGAIAVRPAPPFKAGFGFRRLPAGDWANVWTELFFPAALHLKKLWIKRKIAAQGSIFPKSRFTQPVMNRICSIPGSVVYQGQLCCPRAESFPKRGPLRSPISA